MARTVDKPRAHVRVVVEAGATAILTGVTATRRYANVGLAALVIVLAGCYRVSAEEGI
jgi:hypothetical protein